MFGSKPIGFDSSEMSVPSADPTLPSASSLSSIISTQQPQTPSSSVTKTETSQDQNKRKTIGAGDSDAETRIAKRARVISTEIDSNTSNDSNDLNVDLGMPYKLISSVCFLTLAASTESDTTREYKAGPGTYQ